VIFCPQSGWFAAFFYLFGYHTPYAYASESAPLTRKNSSGETGLDVTRDGEGEVESQTRALEDAETATLRNPQKGVPKTNSMQEALIGSKKNEVSHSPLNRKHLTKRDFRAGTEKTKGKGNVKERVVLASDNGKKGAEGVEGREGGRSAP
jgi:hypothetical protein